MCVYNVFVDEPSYRVCLPGSSLTIREDCAVESIEHFIDNRTNSGIVELLLFRRRSEGLVECIRAVRLFSCDILVDAHLDAYIEMR